MTTALVFDTETTEIDNPELIEAAWLCISAPDDALPVVIPHDDRFEQRYQPTKPSTYGAMAVHHILPTDLLECPPSSSFQLPSSIDYIVGHNIDFDWGVIGKPDVKRICTNAMARYVWPDADSYSQSALLYMLCGANDETRMALRGAHGAAIDVDNCATLFTKILESAPVLLSTWAELYAYSEQCRIPRVMPIGKDRGVQGLTLEEAVRVNPGFCKWALRQDWLDPYLRIGLERAMNPP